MKTCSGCKLIKLLDDFHNANNTKSGKQSQCKSCAVLSARKWKIKNPEKSLEVNRNWVKRNPEASKNYHRKNRTKRLEHTAKKLYNLDSLEYRSLFLKYQNKCAVCLNEETKIDHRTGNIKRLSIDHDHKTGKVRGLLCSNCNLLLGHSKENKNTLLKMIDYINEWL